MIPYDLDPSLNTAEPEPPLLDDGFSPPHADLHPPAPQDEQLDPALLEKSAF